MCEIETDPEYSAFEQRVLGIITAEEYVADLDRRAKEREFINGSLGESWPHGILNTPGIGANGHKPLSAEELIAAVDAVTSQTNPTTTPYQEVEVSTTTPAVKRETQGVDPKLPVQAIVTLVVALAAYFGVDLSPEASGAIGVLIGAVAAYFSPAAKTVAVPTV